MTKYGPESKDLWIQARIDELMDDSDWFLKSVTKANTGCDTGDWHLILDWAKQQATREHAEIEAMTLNAQIDNLELG
jgi:hypothetical protein